NVLVAGDGGLRVIDFFLAKRWPADSDPIDREGQVLGTPPYMAPEQAAGRNRDTGPAADVYALGVLLYSLLTGRRPFEATSMAALLRQVLHDEPPPPSRLQPQLPRALDAICLKCLRKQPEQRYASAAALAEELRQSLQAPHAFPYERLLAFSRGQLPDAADQADVERRLATDRRWRAHWDSIRQLDLERAAARQDARDLEQFAPGQTTPFCRAVAASRGEIFLPLIRRQQELAGEWDRKQWAAHVDRSVYCRRMRRRMPARVLREDNGLPEGEALLRDWLLEPSYRDALDRVTRALAEDKPLAPSATVGLAAASADTVFETRAQSLSDTVYM